MFLLLRYILFIYLNVFSWLSNVNGNECQVLTMCKCSNFPLFTLIDTSYLSKPRSPLNQDLFCSYSQNQTIATTFEQLKYFYYRFRTLTFSNYPNLPAKAFRFVHFESQSIKPTHKDNNRNVLAFVNIQNTESGIFEDLTLPNSEEQLIVSFLNSPLLQYTNRALAKLNCYELKFLNTNPKISIDFFNDIIFINHLIINNPSFSGFISSSNTKSTFTFSLYKLSIKDISVTHLKGKHFPIKFPSVRELILENYHINRGFRSFNHHQLSECFPQIRRLKIYSRSIHCLTRRMFESFHQLEYLILDGIQSIENEAFYNLSNLKELNLGKDLLQIDSYAFIHMNTEILLLNQSYLFQIDDQKHFCTFAQFSSLPSRKTFIQFTKNLSDCSCTLRYLYRYLDKFLMSLTPNCYMNSSLYVLTQEERICYFEQRLLQCDILPNEGLMIYGKYYNVSYFYQRQISKQKHRFAFFFHYRLYYILIGIVFFGCLYLIIRQQKQQPENSTYRHLHRLLKRQELTRNETSDVIYEQPNSMIQSIPSIATARVTKL